MKIKKYLKILLPKFVKKFYQRLTNIVLNTFFNLIFNFPAKKLIIIGVTGTKGKTTTTYLIYEIVKNLGYKVSLLNSEFYIHQENVQKNLTGNTMPGHGQLIKFLNEALKNQSEIAILEVSSEGLMYLRHFLIDFDIGIFLNIHPEHIENHGSFEKYKKDKARLFKAVEKSKKIKRLRQNIVPKTIILNSDDPQATFFANFKAKIISFGLKSQADLRPVNFKVESDGIYFNLWQQNFYSPLLGEFNLFNILAALAVILALNIEINQPNLEIIKETLKQIKNIPGRMEILKIKDITLIIDYAHTPESIKAVFEFIIKIFPQRKRLISLIGSDGGLRDKWKRPIFGELCAKFSDIIVISNINPYDEDEWQIIRMIEQGARNFLKNWEIEKEIILLPDRRKAISWIVDKAQPGDVIVSLVKGNEKYIHFADYSIEWDEKQEFLNAFEKKFGKLN